MSNFNLQEDYFRYSGTLYVAVTTARGFECEKCAFLPFGSPLCTRAPLCSANFRRDNRDVVWQLVNNKDNHWAQKKVTELEKLVNKEIPNE